MKRTRHVNADEVEVGMLAHYKGWVGAPDRFGEVTSVEVGAELRGRPSVHRVTIEIIGAGAPWATDSDEYVKVQA